MSEKLDNFRWATDVERLQMCRLTSIIRNLLEDHAADFIYSFPMQSLTQNLNLIQITTLDGDQYEIAIHKT